MEAENELEQLESLLAADLSGYENSEPVSSPKKGTLRETDIFLRQSNKDDDLYMSPQPSTSGIQRRQSFVHKGDTDSSDDEERRNCLDSKLDEYGTSIKNILAHKERESIDRKLDFMVRLKEATKEAKEEQKKIVIPNMFLDKPKSDKVICVPENKAAKTKFDVYTCPVFGIRIVNPLISSSTFLEKMNGRQAIDMMSVKKHVEFGDLSKDWVIAGVIVRKICTKESQKGGKFAVWTVSDLKNDIKSITLFLFKKAYNDLWKTDVGTVIAVLNPANLDKKDDNVTQATLSVDTPAKIIVLGQSKDYGICKSRKNNGEPCKAFVNINKCEYCVFHVKQEYQKFSKRQELQSSTMGHGLHDLKKKVLGKSTLIYGGQAYSAMPLKDDKLKKQDKNRLMSLSDYYKTESEKLMINKAPYGSVCITKSLINPEVVQRQKDKDILDKLQLNSSPKLPPNTLNKVNCSKISVQGDTLTTTEKAGSSSLKAAMATSPRFNLSNTPKIGQGLDRAGSIDFSISFRQKQEARSKQNAIRLIKQTGGIKKENPHNLKGTEAGKKRVMETLNSSSDSENPKKMKCESQNLNGIKSERFKKILEATSSHQNLIEEYEEDEKEKYFNKLEKKESMEEKMLNTFKLPCKGVRCIKCKYTSFSAAERCKEERHPLKVFDTFKRFFKCGDCANRTVSLDIMPLHSCKNCNSSRWIRAPMIRDKKGVNISEGLSIRGEEESFIGAQVTGGRNINLLVPDES